MIGIDLMCMLINSIANEDAKIIVNMDLGQIAPISCGCPMRDIIKSGIVPVCTLTKVFRYGEGGLYKMATDAYDKKFYINQFDYNKDRISVGANKDYTYVRYNGEVSQIIDEYKKFLNRGIKPRDIAVVTCWNVTEFGTINLNNEIQKIVNPNNNEKVVEKTIRKAKS
jgi:ATP-dependent exoDNAse (exonuclease V), alpha subunit - helicase superfamily I member